MVEEAIMGMRVLDKECSMEPMELKAKFASTRTQLNIFNMLSQLPDVVKEIEDRNKRVDEKIERMRSSQEGATIG